MDRRIFSRVIERTLKLKSLSSFQLPCDKKGDDKYMDYFPDYLYFQHPAVINCVLGCFRKFDTNFDMS